MLALANSYWPTTWPLDNYDSPIWPGWNDVDEEIYDQNIYLELDDRLSDRDVDDTQGYPTGITAEIIVSANNSEYFNDAIIYQLKLINQSELGSIGIRGFR